MLGPLRREAGQEDHRRRRHDVGDPDDRLLGNRRVLHAREGEDERPDEGEAQREDVAGHRPVTGSEQKGHRAPQRRDLRQREVHEDDLPLDDVQTEVGVGQEDDHRRREGRHRQQYELQI